MATGKRDDPFRGFNFKVEIDGVARNGFREISGLDMSTDVVEYRNGNDTIGTASKLPGLHKYSNITLKDGITMDDSLWVWRKTVIDKKTERKNGSIILCDEAGEEKIRWNFREGWPTKYTCPTLNATGNEVAVETLEIAHEGLTKA
jgi:phage tail-like protein